MFLHLQTPIRYCWTQDTTPTTCSTPGFAAATMMRGSQLSSLPSLIMICRQQNCCWRPEPWPTRTRSNVCRYKCEHRCWSQGWGGGHVPSTCFFLKLKHQRIPAEYQCVFIMWFLYIRKGISIINLCRKWTHLPEIYDTDYLRIVSVSVKFPPGMTPRYLT